VGADHTVFECGSFLMNCTDSAQNDCHHSRSRRISRSMPQFTGWPDHVHSVDSSRVATVGHWNLPFDRVVVCSVCVLAFRIDRWAAFAWC